MGYLQSKLSLLNIGGAKGRLKSLGGESSRHNSPTQQGEPRHVPDPPQKPLPNKSTWTARPTVPCKTLVRAKSHPKESFFQKGQLCMSSKL